MLNGGNTWTNNHYFMSDMSDADGGGRFEWGGSKTFTQFKGAAHETGSISQSYPDTSGWLTASPADATPSPPADPAPPPPADTSPPSTPGVNTTIGSGSDSLELKITQDAYQGDSQYAIYVDGKQIGATLTARALHGSGEADSLQVKGDWAAGSHTVSVTLLNDLWGGTTGTDRNIYVESATFDGAPVPGSKLAIYDGTPKSFTVTDTTAVPGSTTPTPASTVINPIEGTGGNDVLTGTAANDMFVFKPNFGNDSIVNFQPGQDYIEIDHTIFADVTTMLAHTADDVHGNAVITADQANTITFHDVSTATLKEHVSDFFFA
jgi:Ca-dependent carbohydrate-binding module xylan-binding